VLATSEPKPFPVFVQSESPPIPQPPVDDLTIT
jgi:hypothetical protein